MANLFHFNWFRAVVFSLGVAGGFLSSAIAQIPPTGCAGTIDPSFKTFGYFRDFPVMAADGNNVIIADGTSMIRYNEDGTIDPTFMVMLNGHTFTGPRAIAKDSQGRWLVAGNFSGANSIQLRGLTRILPNGQVDSSFAPNGGRFESVVSFTAVAIQPDGKIIVGGQAIGANGYYNFVWRLNPDASIDATFAEATADGDITSLAVESDNSVLVGGYFANFAGQPRNQLARVLPNGALDQTFNPARHMYAVSGLEVVADGKILVYFNGFPGGPVIISTNNPGTIPFVRLNKNGSLDTAFATFELGIWDLAIQTDGKYVVADRGSNGNNPIRRLLPTGAEDPTFHALNRGTRVVLDARQRAILGGGQIVRLLGDDDPCVPIISFETDSVQIVESNTTLDIPIIRTGDTTTPASAKIWVYNESPADFAVLETNVTFAAGATRTTIPVRITNNQKLDQSRFLSLELFNAGAGSTIGDRRVFSIAIAEAYSEDLPGDMDDSFNIPISPNYGSGFFVLTPDQKIIVSSDYAPPGERLQRFTSTGARDGTFNYSADITPNAALFWNDRIYITGRDTNDAPALLRLLSDGALDPSFTPQYFDSSFRGGHRAMAVDPDGKTLIGSFGRFNNVTGTNLIRVNADGSLDNAFDVGVFYNFNNSSVVRIAHRLPDGSYLIAGDFYSIDGQERRGFAHISNTGALLEDFRLPFQPSFSYATAITPLPDGRILVAAAYGSGSTMSSVILRYNADGTFDESFQTEPHNGVFNQIILEPSRKFFAVGGPIVRFNADGMVDPAWFPPTWANGPAALDNAGNLYVSTGTAVLRLRTGSYSGPGVFELDAPAVVYDTDGSAKIKILRGWSSQGEVRVRVKTRDGSAHASQQYTAIDTLLTFANSETEKEIEIPIVNNPAITLTELIFDVTLTLETPGAALAENGATAAIAIREGQRGFVLLPSEYPYSGREGDHLFVNVVRIGPADESASVEAVTDDGTATLADYNPKAQWLSFSGGNTRWMETNAFNIQTIDDAITEAPETIRVFLRSPTPGMTLLDPSTNFVTIIDNVETFQFTQTNIDVVQNYGVARLVVQPLLPPGWYRPGKAVSFTFKTEGGSAVPGVEYIPQQGTITFEASDSSPKEITIPLLPNTIVSAPTTFNVRLTPLQQEIEISNPIAQVTLHHPPASIPAGAVDSRIRLGYSFAVTPDFIYSFSGEVENGFYQLSRFHRDGTRDQSFHTTFTNWFDSVRALPDGRLIVYSSTFSSGRIARVDALGAIDPTFNPQLPGLWGIFNVLVRPDGKLILHGQAGMVSFVVQLLPDGSVDPNFTPLYLQPREQGEGVGINQIYLQPDGRILLGGFFTDIRGVARANYARLMPNGELDTGFELRSPDGSVHSIALLPDGKFYASSITGEAPGFTKHIYRFNADGSLDITWQFSAAPAPADVWNDAIVTDGLGRLYTKDATRLMRVLPDGTIDPTFISPAYPGRIISTSEGIFFIGEGDSFISRLFIDPPIALRAPQLLANGQILHTFSLATARPYVIEQTTDFITWSEIAAGTSNGSYVQIQTPAPNGPAGFYRVRGN